MKISIGPYPNKKKKRKIKIRIDNFDIWNADHTLALIILPLLKRLKKDKAGISFVMDEDVPEKIRSDKNPSPNEHDWDKNAGKRWKFVLDEMIFSFDKIIKDDETDQERVKNGLRLFAKYYFCLWT